MVVRIASNESLSSDVEVGVIPVMEDSGANPRDHSALDCEDTVSQTKDTTDDYETEQNDTSVPLETICCPITKKVFEDAVVHPHDGVTYEREALNRRDGESNLEYYPNRALMSYVHLEETDPHTALFEEDIFVCPITRDAVRDPVIDPEGTTYERSAIVGWIQQHGKSPITRTQLQVDQLYDNTTLLMLLIDVVGQQQDEDLTTEESDAICRWKQDMSLQDSFIPSMPDMAANQHPPRQQAQTQVGPTLRLAGDSHVVLVQVVRCIAGGVCCSIFWIATLLGGNYIVNRVAGQP